MKIDDVWGFRWVSDCVLEVRNGVTNFKRVAAAAMVKQSALLAERGHVFGHRTKRSLVAAIDLGDKTTSVAFVDTSPIKGGKKGTYDLPPLVGLYMSDGTGGRETKQERVTLITRKLLALSEWERTCVVIIEDQHRENNHMRELQAQLFGAFSLFDKLRFRVRQKKAKSREARAIVFYQGGEQKLWPWAHPDLVSHLANTRSNYARNKKMSHYFVKAALEVGYGGAILSDAVKKVSKLDDLGDAILHTLAFLGVRLDCREWPAPKTMALMEKDHRNGLKRKEKRRHRLLAAAAATTSIPADTAGKVVILDLVGEEKVQGTKERRTKGRKKPSRAAERQKRRKMRQLANLPLPPAHVDESLL